MKKLITIIALITMFFSANSQNVYNITNASFDTLSSVFSGTEQWIDLKKLNQSDPLDINIGCFYGVDENSPISYKQIKFEISSYFDSLPFNSDSSKRVSFILPWDLPTGKFLIVTSLVFSNCQWMGNVQNATSILELTQTVTQAKYTYTNLLGQSTTQLKGLLIRSDRKLVYFE